MGLTNHLYYFMAILITANSNSWKENMELAMNDKMIVIGIDKEAIFKLKEKELSLTKKYLTTYSTKVNFLPIHAFQRLCSHLINVFVEEDPITKNVLMASIIHQKDDDAWLTYIFSTSVAVHHTLHKDIDNLITSYAEHN